MQRIPPVSEATRRLLTERYCPSQLVENILESDTNRDCLIRPYQGRRRVQSASAPSRFKAFSLRNYLLHLDQMEEIGIAEQDILAYARTMAETLALLHWVAQTDGNDVEFVLASPNDGRDGRTESEGIWSNVLGTHEMGMLDFDLARSMSMDEQGVRQAANAFRGNDPYFPKPDEQSSLWNAFREEYLAMSERYILAIGHAIEQLKALPGSFIRLVEEMACPGGSPQAQDSH
ncbi:zinc finger protein [Aspergillus lucknowensis]|uniref:Zinc finger protein-domain-containing protein n=1 Tax=Aspergillus lucknowensis TaxID=176173 RepID=A0ABR4LE76_9EURO